MFRTTRWEKEEHSAREWGSRTWRSPGSGKCGDEVGKQNLRREMRNAEKMSHTKGILRYNEKNTKGEKRIVYRGPV